MDIEQYKSLSTTEKYDLAAQAIIRALQKLGGQASKQKMMNQIRNFDPIVTEEVFDAKTKSEQYGTNYSDFQTKMNFSLSSLVNSGVLARPNRGEYQLSDELISVDPDDKNFKKIISNSTFGNKKQHNEKKQIVVEEISDSEENSDQEPSWKTELRQLLFKLEPQKFEVLCRRLLVKMNVTIDDTIGISYVGDGGLDGFGYLVSDELRTDRIAIQAKRWNEGNLVSSPEIDKFRGAMDKYNAEYGVFITTSKFTRDAIKASKSGTKMITLIDGEKLLDLIVKYRVYVHKTIVIEDFYKD